MGTSDQYKVFDSILDWSPTPSIVLGPPGVPISLKSVFLGTPCTLCTVSSIGSWCQKCLLCFLSYIKTNIVSIVNDLQCHFSFSSQNDCHEFRFSTQMKIFVNKWNSRENCLNLNFRSRLEAWDWKEEISFSSRKLKKKSRRTRTLFSSVFVFVFTVYVQAGCIQKH